MIMDKLKELNRVVTNLNSLLEVCGSIRGTCSASSLRYKILEIHDAAVDVKIENWSNRYFTIYLDKPMISMMLSTIREYSAYVDRCRLRSKALKENALICNDQLVYLKNEHVKDRVFHHKAIYVLQHYGEYCGSWYGYNAKDALSNALPFLKKTPTTIALVKDSVANS